VTVRCEVVSARPDSDGLLLNVREAGMGERELRAHHLVAGTGFEVDVDRLPFLAPELNASIARIERAPRLNRRFESSVPGLHFVGVMSMFSFGPLFRFVAGTAYAGPVVARHLARTAQRARAMEVAPA
jgi:hypothetical protein